MSIPVSHLEEALKIEALGLADLWEIRFKRTNAIIRFKYGQEATWQGNLYSSIPCQLSGEGDFSNEEHARPTLALMNVGHTFGPYASSGLLDLSLVVRKRLQQSHLAANVNLFQQRIWFIGRVMNVDRNQLQLELRDSTDIPNFMVPPRRYLPPEFPFVRF